jgi:NAD(P)H dehydrogenase (quinone)
MKVMVVLAHPEPKSFNHAIAREAATVLQTQGYEVSWHDLYRERFPCTLPGAEIPEGSRVAPLIGRHCRELQNAAGLVIVHPNWWGQPPAILKGWVDRVFRPGVAYRFLPGDHGEGVPEGLLRMTHALVFNTSNTPLEREMTVMGDPLEAIWKHCILQFCGVTHVTRRMFQVVATSTHEQREGWLRETRELVLSHFPVNSRGI